MICSKTKLGSELEKIKQLLIEEGYPTDQWHSEGRILGDTKGCDQEKRGKKGVARMRDPKRV